MHRNTFLLPKVGKDRGLTAIGRRMTYLKSNNTHNPISDDENSKIMNIDEKVMLYYLMNQILRKEYQIAHAMIKKDYL